MPPLPISPVFLDKLDTYKRRYKSGAAGVARNIVGLARVRKSVDADVLLRSCGAVLSLLDSSIMTEELDVLRIISERLRAAALRSSRNTCSISCIWIARSKSILSYGRIRSIGRPSLSGASWWSLPEYRRG